MRTFLAILLFLVRCFSLVAIPSVTTDSVCLMDADTGFVLFEKKADLARDPASITKVATAAIVLQNPDFHLEDIVIADQDSLGWITAEKKRKSGYQFPAWWLEPDGTALGVQEGEKVSVRDLLYGMMLASGNDCANLLAKYHSKTIPQFQKELNLFLKSIDCKQTHFVNPHGLYHPQHKTSAKDMAKIARYAMQNPLFRSVVSSKEVFRQPTNQTDGGQSIRQSNKLLRPGKYRYEPATGIKTGYIEAAGHTLVASAKKGDCELIVALLGCDDRGDLFQEAAAILEWGFSHPRKTRTVFDQNYRGFQRSVRSGSKKLVAVLQEPLQVHYYEQEPQLTCTVYWDKGLSAPIDQGMRVGYVELTATGKVVKQATLFAEHAVVPSMFAKKGWIKWVVAVCLLVLFGSFCREFFNR